MVIEDGNLASADDVMNAMGSLFNDTAQNIFNADYIGFDSRLTNATTPNLKNVKYSTFTSDDADVNYGFVYNSSTDLYGTVVPGAEYIIIEADDDTVSWTSNDTLLVKIGSGKWLLYGTTGTDAVKRAQIHKSLWYGTDGTNQLILDFANVTAMKTSHADDVGKQGYYATWEYTGGTGGDLQYNGTYTGTFADTSTNTDCSSWSRCRVDGGPSITKISTWEIPEGTTRNTVSSSDTLEIDELGTDTEADEVDNPADCQMQQRAMRANSGGNRRAQQWTVVLCNGNVTWAKAGDVADVTDAYSNVDFLADNSIPVFTATATADTEDATLIFKDTVTSTNNAIPVINSTIDATSSQVISVSANGGSAYTVVNNAEIARPTAGTALWRRIVITRTDLSKEDIVTEQAVKYNLY